MLIQGTWYRNSAAKFWPRFVEHIRRDYPAADSVELAAVTGEPLTRRMLTPTQSLQEMVNRAIVGEQMPSLEDTVAELELIGEPAHVQVRALAAGGAKVLADQIPCPVDADTFPFLVVWLLEWAGIPSDRWNDETIVGDFDAHDIFRERDYVFRFTLKNRHISEGLYERTVRLQLDNCARASE